MSKRAYSVRDIEAKKWVTLPWSEKWSLPFGYPADNARWFISGASASGKSSFVMQLAKELCNYGRVLYMSYEEGVNQSFQRRLQYLHMDEVQGRFRVATGDTCDELAARLRKPKSAKYIIVDSFQVAPWDYPEAVKLLHLDQPREEEPAPGRRSGEAEVHLRHEGACCGLQGLLPRQEHRRGRELLHRVGGRDTEDQQSDIGRPQ